MLKCYPTIPSTVDQIWRINAEAVDVGFSTEDDRIREEEPTHSCCSCNLSRIRAEKRSIDTVGYYTILFNRSEFRDSLFSENLSSASFYPSIKDLVEAYESVQDLLDTYGDYKTQLKDLEMGQMMMKNPPLEQTGGPKGRRVSKMNKAEEEVQHLPDWFQKPTRLPSPDHAWNTSVPAVHETVQPYVLRLCKEKVTNLEALKTYCFNVSLRMFTRRIVIQRRVEDLQLGVESYQKKLNLTKPDTYRSNLRRQDAYTPYSDPRGFIYENKDKKNRLMRIDELHKFSDGTLDDVRTVLNDRLKGIRMEYLPQTFWNPRDKANARAMIQAIDKRLKTRRIMRSLERFVGGRQYGGDLRLLQRTI
ncbi:hypothetical protein Tco_0919776 [Tanacetum coccineum]